MEVRPHARVTGRTASLFALLTALFLVAGCGGGGSEGLGAKPADEIVRVARVAARAATSVHVAGTWVSQDEEYRLDIRVKADGATGTVDTGGQVVELLRVGTVLFVRGDERLYSVRNGTEDDATSAQVLRDKFVKVPEEDPSYARLNVFTQLGTFGADLFQLEGRVKKNGSKTVRGTRVIELVANKGHGGELHVASEGVPFPVRYSPSPTGGRLDLSEYNQDFAVAMPSAEQILDYGTLTLPDAPQRPGGDAEPGTPGPSASPSASASPSRPASATRS